MQPECVATAKRAPGKGSAFLADDPRDLAVLRAIVAMARALDLQVIAEGIENEAQRLLAEYQATDQANAAASP